jgi:hypothetical protein
MAPLDSGAAKALRHLEADLPESEWSEKDRSAWSRFLLAQMLRTPEEIDKLRSAIRKDWSRIILYLQNRFGKDYINNLLANMPGEEEKFLFDIATSLMDHQEIGQKFNNMIWSRYDVSKSGITLLTSDRPVWMTATISEEDAMIVMPIGPTAAFTATRSEDTQLKLRSLSSSVKCNTPGRL